MKLKITHLLLSTLFATAQAHAAIIIADDFTWNSVIGGDNVVGNTLDITWDTDVTGTASDLTSFGGVSGFNDATGTNAPLDGGQAWRSKGFYFTFTPDQNYYLTDITTFVSPTSSGGNRRSGPGSVDVTITGGIHTAYAGTGNYTAPLAGYGETDFSLSPTNHLLIEGVEYTFSIIDTINGIVGYDSIELQGVAAPEPSSVSLLGLGLSSLLLRRKRS